MISASERQTQRQVFVFSR